MFILIYLSNQSFCPENHANRTTNDAYLICAHITEMLISEAWFAARQSLELSLSENLPYTEINA